MEGHLFDAVRAAQAAGEIDANGMRALTRFLLCAIEGMGVLGKTGRTKEEMTQIVDTALRALG